MEIISNFPNLKPLSLKYFKEKPYGNCKLRKAKLVIFNGAMRNYEPFRMLPYEDQEEIISSVEISCCNATIDKCIEINITPTWKSPKFFNRYNNVVMKVSTSIDCLRSGDYLIKSILDNKIDISAVGYFTIDKLCPMANVDLKKRVEARYKQEISEKTSTFYECERCETKGPVKYQTKQLRSQDEGSSTICTCTYCGFRWTIL